VTGEFPLLPLQRWFFGLDLPRPHHWNMATLLEVRAGYPPQLLRRALDHLAAHHDGLRARFPGDGQAVIAGPGAGVPFEVHDLSQLGQAGQDTQVEVIARSTQAGLDHRHGPVVATALFERGPQRRPLLLVVAHHLVIDAVSWRILLEDLSTACEQLSAGMPACLPPKTTSIAAWTEAVEELRGSAALAAEARYWAGVTSAGPGAVPADMAGSRSRNTVGSADTVTGSLDAASTGALLREIPAAYRTQINDALLAALATTLARWTGSGTNLVELEAHGREKLSDDIDLSRTVGWLTAAYPVALTADPGGDLAQTLRAVKEALRAVPRGGIGYGVLRHTGHTALAGAPAPDVSFNYFGQFDQLLPESAPFGLVPAPIGPSADPGGDRGPLIEVSAEIRDGQLHVHWRYSSNVHRRGTVERLARDYLTALAELIEHCRSAEGGGFTAADFPKARLNQAELDQFMATLARTEL
jgi:non-ribosomal peptide synthase protein (TIGR01720 family)